MKKILEKISNIFSKSISTTIDLDTTKVSEIEGVKDDFNEVLEAGGTIEIRIKAPKKFVEEKARISSMRKKVCHWWQILWC